MSDTRDKLAEAQFFLNRMVEHETERDWFRYSLSAFLSAFRSVTWIMQEEFATHSGFAEWYAAVQERLRAQPRVRLLNSKRVMTVHQKPVRLRAEVSVTVKEGLYVTTGFSANPVVIRADGTREEQESMTPPSPAQAPPAASDVEVEYRWYFDEVPEADVTVACRECLEQIDAIVSEWEDRSSFTR